MAWNRCYRGVLLVAALVAMECANVGLNTLFKAATLQGMSYHVFVVYSYAIAALFLLPAPFFSLRSTALPPLNSSIICKIFLLGLIGCSSQIAGYTGITYSSPTLASAISNLIPAFTFILAAIFRMEKVTLTRASSVGKVLGSSVSIIGAFIVTVYKGPALILASPPSISLHRPVEQTPSPYRWAIGGAFLTAEYILVPLWYIVQTQIMKEYPAEATVVFFYNVCVSILAAIVGLVTERSNPSAWRVKPDTALASIFFSGLFGSCINNTVHTWALRLKGPVFVAMFKPLSIAIAVAMGVMFLGDSLYLGSVAGAAIISIGFYTVMWGKAKEEIDEDHHLIADTSEPSPVRKVPLLKKYRDEQV